jgi:ABC-2 type transport system permease protein
MTNLRTPTSPTPPAPAAAWSQEARPVATFVTLLARDLTVLRKNLREFLPRTILQPLLLVFVFTYVFPKIGQGVGGTGAAASAFSTLLVAGVIGTSITFQGIQSVALPLVQEFGFTREIEDRVLAPLPVELVAFEKIVAGALQCLLAALIVFPIGRFVPATAVHLDVHWLVLLTLTPLACLCAASLGLMFGTIFQPRTVPILFGVIVVPLTFLGCVYYPWARLDAIEWLKYAVLVNPLVYITEGLRAALTGSEHMSLIAVYGMLVAFTVLFGVIGTRFFTRRVIA